MKRYVTVNLFLLLVLSEVPAYAQSVSVGVGVQKPGDDRYWFSGSYRIFLKENFSLNPDIGYARRSASDEFCNRFGTCAVTNALFTDLTVGVHAMYTIPKDRVSFSFGGGLGAHFLKSELTIDNTNPELRDLESSNSEVQPGAHFIGEFDVAVSERLSIFLVNRSEIVRKFNDNFKLYGGVRWKF